VTEANLAQHRVLVSSWLAGQLARPKLFMPPPENRQYCAGLTASTSSPTATISSIHCSRSSMRNSRFVT